MDADATDEVKSEDERGQQEATNADAERLPTVEDGERIGRREIHRSSSAGMISATHAAVRDPSARSHAR